MKRREKGRWRKKALDATGAEPSSPCTSRVTAVFFSFALDGFPPPSSEARSISALSPPHPAVAAAAIPPQQSLDVMELSLLGFRDKSQVTNYQNCHDPEIDPIAVTGSDVVSIGGGGWDRNCGMSRMTLFDLGVQYTSDGSFVDDGDSIFVFPTGREDSEAEVWRGRICQIDYFHGLIGGIPIAQMMDDNETNVWATEMLAVQFIRQLVRTWFDEAKSVKLIRQSMRAWFKQTKFGQCIVRRHTP